MSRIPLTTVAGLVALAAAAPAAETLEQRLAAGAKVYNQPGLCATCHQADGNGIPGAFPTLVGSEWVTGDPATLIRLIVHGLEGEITVKGTSFNAVMPAQGGQISDKELADVVTYIRNSWGNKASSVSTKEVAAQKKVDQDRGEKPWTAAELKTVAQPKGLTDPTVRIHPGTWREIPDPATLPAPTKTLNEALSAKQAPEGGGLLIAEGTLNALKNGEAGLTIRANGPTQIWVDGVLALSSPSLISGDAPPRVDRTIALPMTAGSHTFRVVHLATAKVPMNCSASAQIPGYAKAISLTAGNPEGVERGANGLDFDPAKAGEPILYRNLFAQTSPRSIAVGYPERISLLFDAQNGTWTMGWRGDFITGRHHFEGRGMGYREWPLGEQVALLPGEPSFARLASAEAPWPGKCENDVWPEGYRFLGYDLDKARRPTFRYQVGDATITDTPAPLALGKGLNRTLKISAAKPIPGLWFRAIAGKNLSQVAPATFRLGGRLTVRVEPPPGSTVQVRQNNGLTEVLVPVLAGATSATVTEEYLWEATP